MWNRCGQWQKKISISLRREEWKRRTKSVQIVVTTYIVIALHYVYCVYLYFFPQSLFFCCRKEDNPTIINEMIVYTYITTIRDSISSYFMKSRVRRLIILLGLDSRYCWQFTFYWQNVQHLPVAGDCWLLSMMMTILFDFAKLFIYICYTQPNTDSHTHAHIAVIIIVTMALKKLAAHHITI